MIVTESKVPIYIRPLTLARFSLPRNEKFSWDYPIKYCSVLISYLHLIDVLLRIFITNADLDPNGGKRTKNDEINDTITVKRTTWHK
jgi:hypothetical protein